MLLKLGSRGEKVKMLQEFLGLPMDGVYGPLTKDKVFFFQKTNGLTVDGIVGTKTWDLMGIESTDLSEASIITREGLNITKHHLKSGEYKVGPTKKEYIFIHHTAGWHNPYNCIDQWGRDSRGAVATEFVIGGQSIKGNDDTYDGEVLQAFPEGGYGWHLGKNGSQYMHTHSIGIEVCNFGWIANGKTYAGTKANVDQLVKLKEPFRNFDTWHKYSDEQILSLKSLLLYLAERDNIDITEGLPKWVKEKGVKAFEYDAMAYYGKIKGILTHTNTRKDKFDMFPQPELLDMLNEL